MVQVNPVGSNGGKIWQDDTYPWKIYGGVGPGVRAWNLDAGLPCDDTTNSPTSFIATQVGTSPTTAGIVAGYPMLITTGATDYHGSNLQLRGSTATFAASKPCYLRGKFKLSQATTSDFLFGLCQLKTDILKTSSSHGINTAVEGVFFFKAAAATTIVVKAYKAGTEYTSVGSGTLTTSDIDYAITWDGIYVRAYLDNVQIAQFAGTLPDQMCTPTINVRTSAASAVTVSVAELAFVSVE